MGQITISFSGSFGDSLANYSAEEGGHAYAISRAMYFLMSQMARSITLDHALHEKAEYPELSGFGKKAPK
jgi:hypothetical protein